LATDKEAYKAHVEDPVLMWHQYDAIGTTDKIPYDRPVVIRYPASGQKKLLSVTVCTDGLKSYQTQDKLPVDLATMAPEVVNYASSNGVFVQRTMNFLKRDLLKKGWTHYDDVGCAAVLL
jgi:hypothetical protein